MNNKRGGIGAKILLVLILMLLAAGGGAYGYRVLDGKMAVREAKKAVKDVEVADYDTAEAGQIQGYLDSVSKDLETATSRKEVYEILDDFKEDVSKVQTKTQKELEAARKEAEEARNASQNNNNSTAGNTNTDPNGNYVNDGSTDNSEGGYKSNNLTNSEESEESGGILSNLFGSGD